MKHIVFLRHGQSLWNAENRFTGWTDVELTDKGRDEAADAARLMTEAGLRFDRAFTSYLRRAVHTLDIVLEGMNQVSLPVEKSWRLNEKHYGFLQGLNKAETAKKYGAEQVMIWRRSFDVAPDPVPVDDPRNPANQAMYMTVPIEYLPRTESLKDTLERTLPYWECEILPALATADNILVVAHGNSLRSIVKNIKHISDSDIAQLNIPTGAPWVFDFDNRMRYVSDRFLGDPADIQRRMAAVANQANTTAGR